MCNYGCKITNKFLFVCGFYVKLCDFVGSYNIVVFLTIYISYTNNCFTL